MKRILFRGGLVALGLGVAALHYAPYLPRLIWEGYPQATWPAPGSYIQVDGGAGSPLIADRALASPNRALSAHFNEKRGRALLVARNGRLVMEHYAEGITRETRLNSYSLVKSLTGALMLRAVAEGKIAGRDVPIGTLLPAFAGKDIGTLPLCRLLDMRSGIVFEPSAKKQSAGPELKDLEATRLNLLGPMGRLHVTGLDGILDRLVQQPGPLSKDLDCAKGAYSYQNVNTAIAGAVLERLYGRSMAALLSEKIWTPAGAAPADWRRYSAGAPATPYCCLFARPMDWLKVAQFLLDNGTADQPFLPDALWTELMGLDLTHAALRDGVYRDFTYHNILDRPGERLAGSFAYFFGSRGQIVYLMPKERLAVVRFGDGIQLLHTTLYGIARSLDPVGTTARAAHD